MIAFRTMKRILVVDESKAVRDTLSLLLDRDFEVVKYSHLSEDISSISMEGVDLLILGLPSGFGAGASSFLDFASRFSAPVLYLLDSRSSISFLDSQLTANYLVKPFNPYELKEKVAQLLTQAEKDSKQLESAYIGKDKLTRFLEFPYLPESTVAQAKRFALTALPLLIVGEMGCGQERVAKAIYILNGRTGPWIPVYLAEISEESLLENVAQLIGREGGSLQRLTLFLDGVERLQPSGQATLLRFLEKEKARGKDLWILSSSRVDLLEKVYRGEFLDLLYYRLATLTLRLPPLRARRGDLSSLAVQVAHEYGEHMDLGKVSFSPDAIDRICNYLWFGNINEMETVIARTLVIQRKGFIEAQDLLLLDDNGTEMQNPLTAVPAERVQFEKREEKGNSDTLPREGNISSTESQLGNGNFADFRVLINELAHELKNPMVTIKTFAQLLAEKFDDAAFRTHFREMVGSDIERMDDILEALLDFSRFNHPRMERVILYDPLRSVVEEIIPEWGKRNAAIRWRRRGEKETVFVDHEQLRYVFKNIVHAALAQVKPNGEIQIDIEKEGRVTMSYLREGGGVYPLSPYISSGPQLADEPLPLRLLLAKKLLERNGGNLEVHCVDQENVKIRMVFPEN
jgi:two-component system NtrC family response regulator